MGHRPSRRHIAATLDAATAIKNRRGGGMPSRVGEGHPRSIGPKTVARISTGGLHRRPARHARRLRGVHRPDARRSPRRPPWLQGGHGAARTRAPGPWHVTRGGPKMRPTSTTPPRGRSRPKSPRRRGGSVCSGRRMLPTGDALTAPQGGTRGALAAHAGKCPCSPQTARRSRPRSPGGVLHTRCRNARPTVLAACAG